MDKVQAIKTAVCLALGVIGGIVAKLFGGWSEDIITLGIFMVIDFATGLIVAGVFKKSKKSDSGALESKAGWKGLCRKGVTLLIVLIAHRIDITLSVDFFKTATVIAYIAIELLSIVENAGLMGVPIPNKIKQAIEIFREKAEEDADKSAPEYHNSNEEDGYNE